MAKSKSKKAQEEKPKCGLIMPMSECDGLPLAHWLNVKSIIENSLKSKFEVLLVSDRADVGVIHESIVTNLYEFPIVICDVSGRNSNVFFELGLRLAFDMPTVIVKDDATKYSFDTSPIQHVGYPRDLRHNLIEDFMLELKKKVHATYEARIKDPQFSPFLRNFKRYEPKAIETVKEGPVEEVLRRFREALDEVEQKPKPGRTTFSDCVPSADINRLVSALLDIESRKLMGDSGRFLNLIDGETLKEIGRLSSFERHELDAEFKRRTGRRLSNG